MLSESYYLRASLSPRPIKRPPKILDHYQSFLLRIWKNIQALTAHKMSHEANRATRLRQRPLFPVTRRTTQVAECKQSPTRRTVWIGENESNEYVPSCYDKDHGPRAIGVSREREISKCFNLFETPRLLIVRSVASPCLPSTFYLPSPLLHLPPFISRSSRVPFFATLPPLGLSVAHSFLLRIVISFSIPPFDLFFILPSGFYLIAFIRYLI